MSITATAPLNASLCLVEAWYGGSCCTSTLLGRALVSRAITTRFVLIQALSPSSRHPYQVQPSRHHWRCSFGSSRFDSRRVISEQNLVNCCELQQGTRQYMPHCEHERLFFRSKSSRPRAAQSPGRLRRYNQADEALVSRSGASDSSISANSFKIFFAPLLRKSLQHPGGVDVFTSAQASAVPCTAECTAECCRL